MIRPLHDLVLLEVLEDEERVSPGGIALHYVYEKPGKRARVLAVGPGRRVWKAKGGQWHSSIPKPEHQIDTWSSRAVSSVLVEPGDYVVYLDHHVRWHSGEGEWPVTGDQALVPHHALVFRSSTLDELTSVQIGRMGSAG